MVARARKGIRVTERDTTSLDAPCWVETFQLDPRAATDFYGPLFGWSFEDAAVGFTARLGGRRVAGIGQAPSAGQVGWLTYVRVDDVADTLARVENAGGACIAGPAGFGAAKALLSDVTGVPFGVLSGESAEVVDAPDSWGMSSLHTPDIDRAAAFYRDVFGWELTAIAEGGFAEWRLADRRVAIVTPTDGTAVPPHWSINFAVSDADATAQQALRLGGRLLMEPMDTPGFRNAVISDPQGGVFAVSASAK